MANVNQSNNAAVSGVIDSNLGISTGSPLSVSGDSSGSLNNINTTNSANVMNSVFNQLRIPDAIKDLPSFDGNVRLLFEFINNVEEILTLIPHVDGTSCARILLRAIRNKIIGSANEVLNMYGTPLSWEEIKKNLILHYADKRNETSLIRDLHNIRQTNETVERYYSKIIEIYSTIINYVNIHERNASVIVAKRELYSEMCLNTFQNGLREPLGSTIRAMRPSTLAEAFNYCIKEQNTYYMKTVPHHKPPQQQKSDIRHPIAIQQPMHSNYFQQRPAYSVPQFTPQYQSNYRPTRPSTQIQNSNKFKFNTNNTSISRQQPPVPMDTSSGYSYLRQPQQSSNTNVFKQTSTPNFTFKELHNICENQESEAEHNYKPELDQYVSVDTFYQDNQQDISRNEPKSYSNYEVDDSNFQLSTSNNLDT